MSVVFYACTSDWQAQAVQETKGICDRPQLIGGRRRGEGEKKGDVNIFQAMCVKEERSECSSTSQVGVWLSLVCAPLRRPHTEPECVSDFRKKPWKAQDPTEQGKSTVDKVQRRVEMETPQSGIRSINIELHVELDSPKRCSYPVGSRRR